MASFATTLTENPGAPRAVPPAGRPLAAQARIPSTVSPSALPKGVAHGLGAAPPLLGGPRPPSRFQLLLGVLTMALLSASLACGKVEGNREVKEQAQRAAEVEALDKQAKEASQGLGTKLKQAGIAGVAPDVNTLQLTPPQKAALEARLSRRRRTAPTRPCSRRSWTRTPRSAPSTRRSRVCVPACPLLKSRA